MRSQGGCACAPRVDEVGVEVGMEVVQFLFVSRASPTHPSIHTLENLTTMNPLQFHQPWERKRIPPGSASQRIPTVRTRRRGRGSVPTSWAPTRLGCRVGSVGRSVPVGGMRLCSQGGCACAPRGDALALPGGMRLRSQGCWSVLMDWRVAGWVCLMYPAKAAAGPASSSQPAWPQSQQARLGWLGKIDSLSVGWGGGRVREREWVGCIERHGPCRPHARRQCLHSRPLQGLEGREGWGWGD